MPQEPTPQELEQLRDAIFTRRKTEAIKLYRGFSGCDLKDAKDYVEKLMAELEASNPEKFAAKAKGCSVSALAVLIAVACVLFFVLRGHAAEKPPALPLPTTPLPTLQEVLDSKQDLWGLAAMRQTNGANYDFFEKLLPPLCYVNAAFHYYPFVMSGPGAPVKARFISNGSGINSLAKTSGWKEVGTPITFRVGPNHGVFGEDSQRLHGPVTQDGYLPVIHNNYRDNDVVYEQETFPATASPFAEHGVVFIQFRASHGPPLGRISAQIDSQVPLTVKDGAILDTNGAVLVAFGNDWTWNPTNKTLEALLAEGKANLAVATAPFESSNTVPLKASDYALQRQKCIDTWEFLVKGTTQVSVPETIINAAWKATIVSNFELLHGDHMNYSAGNAYDVMYEAESGDAVRALMLWNKIDDARRMIPPLLDYGINPGLKFHDAAFKLQLLAHYYWLTRDAQFVREQKSRWAKSVEILISERDAKTGLLPKENYCGDEFEKVFSLNANANAWRGLRDMSVILEKIGEKKEAARIAKTAKTLHKATIAAVEQSERRDVQPTFIPIALFGAEKPYDVLTASRRGSYWNLMIPYVIGSGIFSGTDRETAMLRYLEEHGGICMGMIRFNQHSGLFANEDGLDDLYGLRYVDALLRRDEPERASVSFYGKLTQGMTRTFLSAEGSGLRPLDESGRPMYLPPTCSGNALFLWQLRLMLVQDYDLDNDGEPETLRLLFGTPKHWLENRKEIKIVNAPTTFGPVSVHAISKLEKGEITAEIKMPERNTPKKTLFRLRVPEGWKIVSATAGSKSLRVDKEGTMDISKLLGTIQILAKVEKL